MNKQRIYIFMIFLMMACVLVSCVSQEVRTVIKEIDALGDITLDSYERIISATQKYEALTTEDKERVKNIDDLISAQKKYAVLDLEKRMEDLASSTASLDTVDALLAEYSDSFDDGQKEMFNKDVLERTHKRLAALEFERRMMEVVETATDIKEVNDILEEYRNSLDDYQKDLFNKSTLDAANRQHQAFEVKQKMEDALANSTSETEISALLTQYDKYFTSSQKKVIKADVVSGLRAKNKALSLNTRIVKACAYQSTSLTSLQSLKKEYQSLSQAYKKYVTNYDLLDPAIKKAQETYAKNVVARILDKANGSTQEAWKLYQENAELLNDEQNLECLLAIVRWLAFDKAEEKLIDSLINPRAYYRYGGKAYAPEQVEGDKHAYIVRGSIDCSSTNSFGGTIRKTFYFNVEVYVYPAIHEYSIFDSKIRIY